MRKSVAKLLTYALVVALYLISPRCLAEEKLPQLSFSQEEDGVTILVDGKLFTRYLLQSGSRPVLWPIIGPTDKQMTRAYPVAAARPGEKKDHIHHRSLWIGYEGLDGNDFWHELEKGVSRAFPAGEVKHRLFQNIKATGNTVSLVAKNDWQAADGSLVCTDTRTFSFGVERQLRWIDCLLELQAASQPLTIGDSKEGFFAVRVASTMRPDRGQGGRIVSSTGKTDADAWSQHAKWVDYHGPVDGETVGLAILSHPESYNPVPRWHVRTYGLFSVNPFGELAFTDPKSKVKKRPLRMTLPAGESLLFRYRVILHTGDEQQADIADEFLRFSQRSIRDL